MKNEKFLNRRKLIQALSLGGVGTALLAYQNCSNVGFGSMNSSSLGSQSVDDPDLPPGGVPPGGVPPGGGPPSNNPSCIRPPNIYDLPARPPMTNAALSSFDGKTPMAASGDHLLNGKFYRAMYYDFTPGGAQKAQYFLTIDVGPNPRAVFHPVANSNFANLNIVSDVYVYRQDTGQLILSKRFGGHDQTPSAFMLLDSSLVSAGVKLVLVARCYTHGFYTQTVDLASTPLDYSTTVGTFNAGTAFGGSSAYRPYISLSATGGQGDIGAAHSPHFHTVTNTQVQCTLGPVSGRHGRGGPDHYIAHGLLFDQNGDLMAQSEQMYSDALNHNFVFKNLDLAGRGVKIMRAVLFDTYNGVLQGFIKL